MPSSIAVMRSDLHTYKDGAEVAGVARQDLGHGVGEDRVTVDVEEFAESVHRRADLPSVGHAAGDQLVDARTHGTEAVTAAQVAAEPSALEERGAVRRILDHLLAGERADVARELAIA
ncbi:MAG TPA: hypothetical protein VGD80_32405 [Kofleriaceae bacterium]